MDVKSFYSSPEVLGFNRLPPRAAMIEGRSVEGVRRGVSDRLRLDGEWEFYTFDSPDDAFGALEACGFSGECRRIRVPSSWGEIAGFDAPHYTNVQMPFAGSLPAARRCSLMGWCSSFVCASFIIRRS